MVGRNFIGPTSLCPVRLRCFKMPWLSAHMPILSFTSFKSRSNLKTKSRRLTKQQLDIRDPLICEIRSLFHNDFITYSIYKHLFPSEFKNTTLKRKTYTYNLNHVEHYYLCTFFFPHKISLILNIKVYIQCIMSKRISDPFHLATTRIKGGKNNRKTLNHPSKKLQK